MRDGFWATVAALLIYLPATAQQQPRVIVNDCGCQAVTAAGADAIIPPAGTPAADPSLMPMGQPGRNPNQPALSDFGLRFTWNAEPPNSPFREGSWVAMTYVSGIFPGGLEDSRMFGAHVGGGYYFRDNMSMNLTMSGYWGDHTINSDNGYDFGTFGAGSVEGFMRCHFVNYGSWSLYGEAGLGFWLGSEPVPAIGTKYNFELTAGGGMTKQISDDVHLMAGIRYYHLSNGSFFNSPTKNRGLDAIMVYTGLLYQY